MFVGSTGRKYPASLLVDLLFLRLSFPLLDLLHSIHDLVPFYSISPHVVVIPAARVIELQPRRALVPSRTTVTSAASQRLLCADLPRSLAVRARNSTRV